MGLNIGSLVSAGVGAFTGNPALIASGVGGLLSSSQRSGTAGNLAAGLAYNPVDINTGIGSTTFDKETGYTSTLSPELQALRDRLIQQGGEGLDAFQTFDPTAAGALFTDQLDVLAQPREEQQRLSLENRLFKQGLSGSTGGAARTEALYGAQGIAQNQRDLTGLQQGQLQQDRLFKQALQAISGGTGLDGLSADQLNQALQAAGGSTAASSNQARAIAAGETANTNAQDSFFNSLSSSLGDFSFGSEGLFNEPIQGQTQAEMLAAQNAGLF